MRPTTAISGQMALNELKRASRERKPFRLVILAANMPEMHGVMLTEKIKLNPKLSGTKLMMLSSIGVGGGDEARCRQMGFAAYLSKPIRPSALLESIQVVLDLDFTKTDVTPPLITRHNIGKKEKPFRILLAEDNEINQKVMDRILRKNGFDVFIVPDGEQAVSIVEKEKFDVVLMDVQMPKLDAFDATALIRKNEKATGKHISIVALTAHAMKGDRERCLKKGMDDYLPKPVRQKELMTTLNRILKLH